MIFLKDTRFDAQISPSASGEAHASTGIIVSVVVSRLRERDNGKNHKKFIHNRMFCICSADVPLLGIEAIAGRSSSTHFARFEVRFLGENLCTIKRSRGREARRGPSGK